MPWEHCGAEILDDQLCPSCGVSKDAWTIEWNATRVFKVQRTGQKKHFLRLLLVDGAGAPVAGEPFSARLPDESVVEGALDDFGTAKLAATPGRALVCFPDRSAETLQACESNEDRVATWEGDEPAPTQAAPAPSPAPAAPPPPPAGESYTVVSGDTLSGIAARFGLSSWRAIYDHERNAEFRAKRPDPNLIHVGDVLFVPAAGAPAPAPTPAPAPEPAPAPPSLPPGPTFQVSTSPRAQHRFQLTSRAAAVAAAEHGETAEQGEAAEHAAASPETQAHVARATRALALARRQLDRETATLVNSNTNTSYKDDPAAWNLYCLAFVASVYEREVDLLRAPSAIASYQQFLDAGRIRTDENPPAGAPLFFAANSKNGGYGHITIATGEGRGGQSKMISTGWPKRSEVFEIDLATMEAITGTYLGYGLVGPALEVVDFFIKAEILPLGEAFDANCKLACDVAVEVEAVALAVHTAAGEFVTDLALYDRPVTIGPGTTFPPAEEWEGRGFGGAAELDSGLYEAVAKVRQDGEWIDLAAQRFEVEGAANLLARFAPVLKFSTPNSTVSGVDLKTIKSTHPHTDYVPVPVSLALQGEAVVYRTSHAYFKTTAQKGEALERQPTLQDLGNYDVSALEADRARLNRPKADYILDFGTPLLDDARTAAEDYVDFTIQPTVYAKHMVGGPSALPTCVQYWFFYYYNHWHNIHEGDWEFVLVFLDADQQPRKVAYSVHTNRWVRVFDWDDLEHKESDSAGVEHVSVFVANGGHACYPSPENSLLDTDIDVHRGDAEWLAPRSFLAKGAGGSGHYDLVSLDPAPAWLDFYGNWGRGGPKGPKFRTDAGNDLRPWQDPWAWAGLL